MKKILSYFSILAAGLVLFSACQKETDIKAQYTTTDENAFVRIIHASPFFRTVFNAPDSVNVFVNNVKVNGPLITYGGLFPASGTAFGYVAVPTGTLNLKLSVAGVVTPDSIALTTFTKVVAKGQYYSFILTDNIKNPNDSAKIILQDFYTKPGNGNYSLRLVHAVLNDTVGKNIDVFSTRRNANIYNNIKPGQIVNFSNYPYNSQLNDTLYVRRAGTLQTLATTIASFGNQRAYTIVYRGDGNLSTGTKVRSLIPFLHQ